MHKPLEQIQLNATDGIAAHTLFSRVMCEALAENIPNRLLDIGCGSGVIGIFSLLNGSDYVYFNDIQDDATQLTQQNLQKNQLADHRYQLLNGPFQEIDLNRCQFDAVAFNPPQLPTEMVSIENFSDHREKIFRDGGPDGLKLIEQFIHWLATHLPETSRAYLGISSMLLIDDLIAKTRSQGLRAEKRLYHQVPLRELFYSQVEKMDSNMREARELSYQEGKWFKKIYSLEFTKC